jgi:hypothetical protein
LAAKGLRRIQIEGEDEEYLMDMEGNIYDLRGNFIGTTDDDGAADGGAGTSAIGTHMAGPQTLVDDPNEDDIEYGEY